MLVKVTGRCERLEQWWGDLGRKRAEWSPEGILWMGQENSGGRR